MMYLGSKEGYMNRLKEEIAKSSEHEGVLKDEMKDIENEEATSWLIIFIDVGKTHFLNSPIGVNSADYEIEFIPEKYFNLGFYEIEESHSYECINLKKDSMSLYEARKEIHALLIVIANQRKTREIMEGMISDLEEQLGK